MYSQKLSSLGLAVLASIVLVAPSLTSTRHQRADRQCAGTSSKTWVADGTAPVPPYPAPMDTNLILLSGIALEIAVLFRGLRAARLKKYPLFYAYIGCVLLIELLRAICYRVSPNFYPVFYWHTELVTIAASYAVIFEIFRQALRYNRGVARVAQKVLLVVFVIALA